MPDTFTSSVKIEIMENGPYIVKGLKRLLKSDGQDIETSENIALCRCGSSKNKPFCDGTHKEIGFSGKREKDRPLRGTKAYKGSEVIIHDNRAICAHAGYCIHDLSSVFKQDERPWIDPNGSDEEAIVALAYRCPSGAIIVTKNGERLDLDDRSMKEEIVIDNGGPYNVRGEVALAVDEGLKPPVSTRYSLCRCGASKNKPYCDGSHHNLESGWDS
ncbi:MAG: CDGSH iron-sulfur domain-containing protein [Chlorobi bacterium]|nr:CDGSH iron-sulfur domain-containing protein [Chlorobiota bacterium]